MRRALLTAFLAILLLVDASLIPLGLLVTTVGLVLGLRGSAPVFIATVLVSAALIWLTIRTLRSLKTIWREGELRR